MNSPDPAPTGASDTAADPAPADPAPVEDTAADPAPADPAPVEDTAADPTAPNAARFGPLAEEVRHRWAKFCAWDEEYFPNHVGMVVEELRKDYARLRLPWKGFLRQPEGVMHGGVIASLVDTAIVPAISAHYDTRPRMATVHLGVQYLRTVRDSDIVAEAWVEHRGRSMVYCRAEVRSIRLAGKVELVASASLVFRVSVPSSQTLQDV